MSGRTSLARQLNRLKTPQTSLFVQSKIKESFLYDSKQAATIDLDTHYSIALSGLNELASIDSSCNDFQSTLFKETSKSVDRSTLSKEENADLNQEIEHFLYRVVSPYFLMTATHKVIEWLIFKYQVHKFNASELLFAILPYHETRYFTRIVQICELSSNYYWLEHLKKTGTILVKSILHDHLNKHPELLRSFSDKLIENIKLNYDTSLWTSFLTSTVIAILDKTAIDENVLVFIVQYINETLKLSNRSLTVSAYLIFAYLSTKAKIEDGKLKKILRKMERNYSQFASNKPKTEFVYCLSTICLHQNVNSLPDQITNLLLDEHLYKDCDLKTPCLLSSIINNLVTRLDDNQNLQLILDLLSTIPANYFVINSMIRKIVEQCDQNEELFQNCTELMKLIERRYPNQFDQSIEQLDQSDVSKILHSNLYLKLDQGNIKLVNAINHSNSKIRLASLDLLKEFDNYELLDLNSKETICNAIKSMLNEQDRKVLLKLLDVRFLDKILSKQDLVECSAPIFAKCNQKITDDSKADAWIKIRDKFFNLLIQTNYTEEEFLNIFSRYLFAYRENDLHLFNEILKSESMLKIDYAQHLAKSFKSKKLNNLTSVLESVFSSSADYVLVNGYSFIDSLISQKNNYYNCVCALAVNSIVLENSTTFDQINDCANRCVQILNCLLFNEQDHFEFVNLNEEDRSSIKLFRNQFQAIDNQRLIVEFISFIIDKLISTIEYSDRKLAENEDFYVNSIFTLLCNLINRKSKSSSQTVFRSLFANFIEKCDKAYNFEYFISMWINKDNPILQARSLAICAQTLKNHHLSESDTLHLLIALSSPSIDVRKLALNVLLNINLNSNDLISLAAKNSNEYQISNTAICRVLVQSDSKKRKHFLNLAAKQLDDYTRSFNLTYGLLNLLSKDFTNNLINSLNNIATDLLSKKEQLTSKENEILALVFTLYLNFFADEKNLQMNNYKLAIQNFCEIVEYDQTQVKEFIYGKLKKKWILNLKSNTLTISLIHTLLNDFISTGSEKAKSKLINLLNDGKIVSYLINKYTLSTTCSTSNQLVDQIQQIKKQSIEDRLPFDVDNLNWKKVLILLEIIQSKNEINNSTSLLKCLFVLLKDALRIEERPSIEYLKQLILYNMHNCLEQPDCDVQHFEIDLLFNLMGRLRLKASQTAVLTILNMVTPHFKKEILNNFILIFTYIGTNMMDFSGEYEMKLVDDTLDTIIPCLLEENDKLKNQITDSFIDALADIPSHRLVHIFGKLIKLYKTDNSLWYVLFKLDIRTVRENLFEETEFLDFTLNLISLFNTRVNLNTLVNVIVTSIKILDSNFIFGTDTITRKESAKLNLLLAKQLNVILDSDVFLNQISIAEWNEVNLDLKNLVEQLILLIIKLEEIANKNEQQEQLHSLAYETLNKVNNLLPLEEFSDILQHLLNNGLQPIYQKTLKVFIKKLSSTSNFDISDECWMNIFASLISIIERCTKEQDEQTLITGQYAFVGLKLIAKHLEHKEDLHGELVRSIEITLNITKELDIEQPKVFNLFVSAVLCLGKLACVIKNQAIAYISSIVQLVLKAFQRNTDLVNLSCFAVLAKLTRIFPTYLGAFLPEILIKICSLSKRRAKLADLNGKLSIVEKNIVGLIPFRKLIEILLTTYKQISTLETSESLAYFLKFAETAFRPLKLSVIDENIASINKFIFKLIDYRNENHKKLSGDILNKLENCSLSIICTFLPKLKESKFKLFIIRLYDWATAESKVNYRLQTFYSLTNKLADSVKVMFPVFVTPVIAPNCLRMLSKEVADDQSIDAEQKHSIILDVLKTISKSIHYNVKSVLSSTDIERFVDLIVDQLDYDFGTNAMYEERVKDGVSSCVRDLVKHFNDFQMVKNLQMKILEKTKQKNKVKKYNALHVLHQFILSNTEEYVSYLPDAVPYLVELYEDDSEDIQTLLVTIFRDVEQLINEPISNYL